MASFGLDELSFNSNWNPVRNLINYIKKNIFFCKTYARRFPSPPPPPPLEEPDDAPDDDPDPEDPEMAPDELPLPPPPPESPFRKKGFASP